MPRLARALGWLALARGVGAANRTAVAGGAIPVSAAVPYMHAFMAYLQKTNNATGAAECLVEMPHGMQQKSVTGGYLWWCEALTDAGACGTLSAVLGCGERLGGRGYSAVSAMTDIVDAALTLTYWSWNWGTRGAHECYNALEAKQGESWVPGFHDFCEYARKLNIDNMEVEPCADLVATLGCWSDPVPSPAPSAAAGAVGEVSPFEPTPRPTLPGPPPNHPPAPTAAATATATTTVTTTVTAAVVTPRREQLAALGDARERGAAAPPTRGLAAAVAGVGAVAGVAVVAATLRRRRYAPLP